MEVVIDNDKAVVGDSNRVEDDILYNIIAGGLIHIGGGAINTPKCQCPWANANPSGMKNLPIAIEIAAMSFKSLKMLQVAVGFAFRMLTPVAFYQLFRRAMAEALSSF
jgi:hypothetical protein